MLETMGRRQQDLLECLLRHKEGVTVDKLSEELEITRNAVRQHLAALELSGLVEKGATRPSGGRPEQLYVLTAKGHGMFPRQYSWFAELLLNVIVETVGEDSLQQRLRSLGERTAQQLKAGRFGAADGSARLEDMAHILAELGYRARPPSTFKGIPVIEADNCVFHDLARQHPAICHFDLALMEAYTGRAVNHSECMATGGNVCRFEFKDGKK